MAKPQGQEVKRFGIRRKVQSQGIHMKYESLITFHSKVIAKQTDQKLNAAESKIIKK